MGVRSTIYSLRGSRRASSGPALARGPDHYTAPADNGPNQQQEAPVSVSLVLWTLAVIALTISLFISMVRLIGGPNTLDRIISLDMLAAIAQGGIGIYIAWTQRHHGRRRARRPRAGGVPRIRCPWPGSASTTPPE